MKERALFARALASFLPPEVAELVEASPTALSLREEVEATILFSDIRGFSSLAERLPAREVADVVGRHLAAMVEVVTANGGVLDKFAGDAVMAGRLQVHPIQRPITRGGRWRARPPCSVSRWPSTPRRISRVSRPSRSGSGSSATVVREPLGGQGRLDYTVLGDAVNIAQRLQAVAVGGEILATAVTVQQSGTDQAEPIGLQQLKEPGTGGCLPGFAGRTVPPNPPQGPPTPSDP